MECAVLDFEQQEEPLPAGIEATMDLLKEGIEQESLIVLRQRMDDTGKQIVYDLAVARMVSSDDVVFLPVARLMPQLEEDATTSPSTSSTIN